MDLITEDHQLALEMIKLLNNELKAVRQQFAESRAKVGEVVSESLLRANHQ